ncbi:MAG TPA: GNAT family N-acetyltransferase [Candidatus Kapabacteria bacterium]|nr:GNAT family N-acetyltransferase [Candidatus Kapabacteria bacterium]
MQIFAETDRLILREILPTDDEGMFELDSDPDVHTYIGRMVKSIDESHAMIESIRKQYADFGIGRWAMIEKLSGEFMGWTGLKYCTDMRNDHINYYDVGYRLIKRYWGKGFATESAIASLEYGFGKMDLPIINATADMNNLASRRVLEKCGLKHIETYDDDGYACAWLEITKQEWLERVSH